MILVTPVYSMHVSYYQHWKDRSWLNKDAVYFHDPVTGVFYKDWITMGIGWMTGRRINRALAKAS